MITKNPEMSPILRRSEFPAGYWNPWNEMEEMRRGMDDLFGRFMGFTPVSRLIPSDGGGVVEPLVEIFETAEELLFFLAVPGFELKTIEVSVTADLLNVHGERKPLFNLPKDVRVYRRYGLIEQENFVFNYTLPVPVDPNNVKATLHQGILELHLPKIVPAKAATVNVKIDAE